jgi:hypothetical protein
MKSEHYLAVLPSRYGRPQGIGGGGPRGHLNNDTGAAEEWAEMVRSGAVPGPFATAAHRRYADAAADLYLAASARPPELTFPSPALFARAVAADLPGVLAAEAHAKELAQRLRPWGAVFDGIVVWYITTRPLDYVAYLAPSYESARDTLDDSLEDAGVRFDEIFRAYRAARLPYAVRKCLAANHGWHVAVREDLPISSPRWPLDGRQWMHFRQLQNPFETLLDLWCTGYLLFSEFTDKDPVARLYIQWP